LRKSPFRQIFFAMTIRALDMRVKVGLATLVAIAAAMVARPAHAEPVGPTFPQPYTQAICELSLKVKPQLQTEFWAQVDREFKLSDRQRLEVRVFCLGYQRGLLASIAPSHRKQ
jgi:hypothetical protein